MKKKNFLKSAACSLSFLLFIMPWLSQSYTRRSGVLLSLPTRSSQAGRLHSYFAQHLRERNPRGFPAGKRWFSSEPVFCTSFLSTLGTETSRAAIQWRSVSQRHPRRGWKVLWFCYTETGSTNLQETEVWTLELFKRANTLLLAQSEDDFILINC